MTFRGNARREIFVDDRDRERLTERVGESAEDFGARVYEYCWMPNHGHLLVETPAANVSAFMASVLTVSYLARQVKARCRIEPDTAELVRRVTLAEVPR